MKPKYQQKNSVANEVWTDAWDKLSAEDKKNLAPNYERLTLIRNLGDIGAKELMARIGMHLITGEADLRKLPYLLHEE